MVLVVGAYSGALDGASHGAVEVVGVLGLGHIALEFGLVLFDLDLAVGACAGVVVLLLYPFDFLEDG